MLNFKLNYTHPWLLLLIIPALILTLIPYFKVAKKYRRTRNRVISMVLHSLAMVLAINLLAGVSFSYEVANKENEVILLVDASYSNQEQKDKKDEFVQSVINICDKDFKVGVVKFGYDQKYVAPLSDQLQEVFAQYLVSEDPDITATDLASALKFTAKQFTNPHTAKIVVISDGIETDSAATAVIKSIAADGIKVDTVFFENGEHNEVQIMAADKPEQNIMLGEDFVVNLRIKNNLKEEQYVSIKAFDNGKEIAVVDEYITKQDATIPIKLALSERGMHELRFEIESGKDTLKQNNAYHIYVNLQTFDNILLIERYKNESEQLQSLLKDSYNVTAISIEQDVASVPKTIQEMAAYEQVILVNIAYSDMPVGFEELLNKYVYDLGGGLLTAGGRNEIVGGKPIPHAYNVEDMAQSKYYKQMLPVNVIPFTPPVAVMIVVDTSHSMEGKLEAALDGAKACLDALQDRDYCGVMAFDTMANQKESVLQVGSYKDKILESIQKIGDKSPSGNTVFWHAIEQAGLALSAIDNVERKHVILVSDGQPGDPYEEYSAKIRENLEKGITLSIVTTSILKDYEQAMKDAAALGEGGFYNVTSSELETLPQIMEKDLKLEVIPDIAYGEAFVPTIKDKTPVVAGITQESIPSLTGYYGTLAKKDASVPLMGQYVPIYAHWKYGRGNVGSFMCDLNGEWSAEFLTKPGGQALINNIVHNIFPMEDVVADGVRYDIKTDNYTTQLNVYGIEEGEQIRVEINPLSEDLFDLRDKGIAVHAAESNRRFTFAIKDAGLYEIKIIKLDAAGNQLSETVIYRTFSYSEEYNAFPEREPVKDALLAVLATDGRGVVVAPDEPAQVFESFEKTLLRTFDPRVLFLILIIVFLLVDIAVRKFKFKWIHELIRERRMKKAENTLKDE